MKKKNEKQAILCLSNNNLLFLKPKPFSPLAAEIYSIKYIHRDLNERFNS